MNCVHFWPHDLLLAAYNSMHKLGGEKGGEKGWH